MYLADELSFSGLSMVINASSISSATSIAEAPACRTFQTFKAKKQSRKIIRKNALNAVSANIYIHIKNERKITSKTITQSRTISKFYNLSSNWSPYIGNTIDFSHLFNKV
ncbi:hypothetical protein V6Z12_D01G112500 [Gossypium hirsutum]